MKKVLFAAALAGMFAGVAHAQSSVTLYGAIDAGITYTSNSAGHANWQESSGAETPSIWGLRGAEDLGGGLKAIFTLEDSFSINNGKFSQSGREFDRQAFVGLASDKFGTLTFGRQYDALSDYVGPLAMTGAQAGNTFAAHPFDNDNLNQSFSVNNAVKYQSPTYSGLQFEAMYGFSGGAGQFSNNRVLSVGATYGFSGLTVAAGYLQVNNSFGGNTAAAATSMLNMNGAVSGDNTLLAAGQKTWGLGANYAFGPATVGFVYTQTNLTDGSGLNASTAGQSVNFYGNDVHFQNFELNGRYALTPALSVAGAYTYTQADFGAESQPKWGQLSLQADYALSKRTDLYVLGEYQHVMNGEGLHGETVGAMVNNTSEMASSTGNQVAMTAGLRHRF